MRSVYTKVLLWCFGTLILSLAAFFIISRAVTMRAAGGGGPFEALNRMQSDDAREAFESGGPQKLAAYLAKINRYFTARHYFTDASGRDLLTGEDRSSFLKTFGSNSRGPQRQGDHMIIVRPSSDGRYRFIVQAPPPISIWQLLPYYLLVLFAIAVLCWVLAAQLASPLNKLAHTVQRFGNGDLSARVRLSRRDEVGDVGRAFDEMADRIEMLLNAERRLLQDVSHELRSPLARLSFAAELVRTAQDRDAAVSRMKKEILRLTDLVGALVEVTRVEGDPSTRKLDPVSLNDLVSELVHDCQVEADGKRCRLELQGGSESFVQGDRELLRRAIENVLRNAIRYSPEDSRVEVKMDSNAKATTITVRDFGPGVPKQALGEIFRPFFRVDGSRTGSTGGVGLGLAIVERAVTLHHGAVHAENANPGLLVRIELPAFLPDKHTIEV